MAQQTAVEWLVEQMEKDSYQILFGKLNASIETIEQAKAMEKEQIELAYKNGANDEFEHWMNNEERKTSIGYYKRAYKK
jgi:hypothetical protein